MHKHYLIYKPYGFLSQFQSNDRKQQRKKFLGALYDFPDGVMAIGRLDEKSEGLLLLTSDGTISNFFNSSKVEKEYFALVDGEISTQEIDQLSNGVSIGLNGRKYQTKPCKVKKLIDPPRLPIRKKKIRDARHGPVSWISITLTEGKFRQVRKMTSAVGFPTLRLVRVRIGNHTIGHMQVGEVKEMDSLI